MSGEPEQTKNQDWFVEVHKETGYYEIFNVGPDNDLRFYMVRAGQYGNPIIIAEPDLAFDAPSGLLYLDVEGNEVKPSEKIAGIICQGERGAKKPSFRTSLTSARAKGIEIKPNDDGSIRVGDTNWWIAVLLQKDKNRIVGYDAFLTLDRPDLVNVLELGNLVSYFHI